MTGSGDRPDSPNRPAPDSGGGSNSGENADGPVGMLQKSPAPTPGEITDHLPDELDARGLVGPYMFPNNNRRRIPAVIYIVLSVLLLGVYSLASGAGPRLSDGLLWGALALAALGVYQFSVGWSVAVDENDALAATARVAGFPVGHASAQLAWRGLASRPTWRILFYSCEEQPTLRGIALVDAVSGEVLEHFVEDNPEEWSPQ